MHMDSEGGQARDSAHIRAAWAQVSVFVASVDARVGKWLVGAFGIGLTEYAALVNLSAAPGRELRINELADTVGLDQSSVTRLLGRLESKGLTYRDVCVDDRRGVYAVINDAGEQLVSKARVEYETKLAEFVAAAAFPPHLDRGELSRSLLTIGDVVA